MILRYGEQLTIKTAAAKLIFHGPTAGKRRRCAREFRDVLNSPAP